VLAEAAGIHSRKVAAIRNGDARPRPAHVAALIASAGSFSRSLLREIGVKPPRGDVAACRMYLQLSRQGLVAEWLA
jgi:hypothetical protein